MEPFELHSPKDERRGGHDILRVEKAGPGNEGKVLVSITCPQTSQGAQIYLTATQVRELVRICEYLTK